MSRALVWSVYARSRLFTPLLLIGLALFAGPVVEFVPDMMWHDRQRIGQAILLTLTSLACANVWRQSLLMTLSRLPKLGRRALGLGFAMGCVSVTQSLLPRFASLEWATFLLLVGLLFVLTEQARAGGTQFDAWAMRLVMTVSVVIMLRIMMGYLAAMAENIQLDTVTLFASSFTNRRVFGQVASMVIPLLAYPLLKRDTSPLHQVSMFALLAMWWMLAIMSGTRGTWVALAVAALFLVIFAWRACAGWLKIQMMALGAGALLFKIFFVWLPTWLVQDAAVENRLSNIVNLSGRGELWALAWSQIQAHPWLGIGPMQLAAIPIKFGAHPHNAVLQLAAEWGAPAALAFILPVVYGEFCLLAKLRRQAAPNPLLMCLTASLLAASTQSMVDGVIVIPYTQIWLAFVAGWALGLYFRDTPIKTVVPDLRAVRWGISALSLFALVGLLNGIFPEVLHRVEATQTFIKEGVKAGKQNLPPRYWAVGPIP